MLNLPPSTDFRAFRALAWWRCLLILPLLTLLAACSTTQRVSVTTDYDKATNFQPYRTYDWFQDQPTGERDKTGTYDTFADRRLRTALEAELTRKGLTRTATNPDLKIAYDITVKTEQRADPNYAFAPGFGYGYSYWYGYRYNYGFNRFGPGFNTTQYRVGTVLVDFVDAKANELIWRGVGESVVDPGAVSEAAIQEIVAGILAKYPPEPKK
jgi:Domain of unknown function (DUF4136)